MERRRQWSTLVRALHEVGCSRLAVLMARANHTTRKAVIYYIMQDCASVNPNRPLTLTSMLRANCVRCRWEQAEVEYMCSPTGYIYCALNVWLDAHWLRRLLTKNLSVRMYVLGSLRAPQRRSPIKEYLHRRKLKKMAEKRRTGFWKRMLRRILRLMGGITALTLGIITVASENSLSVEGKEELIKVFKDAFKMFWQNL